MALRDARGTPAREPAADPGGRPVDRELGGTDPALARERAEPACPREDSPLANCKLAFTLFKIDTMVAKKMTRGDFNKPKNNSLG